MTTTPITAGALIERIRRLPEATQHRLRDAWPPGVPSLKDPACTSAHVERVAALITRIAAVAAPDEQPDVAAVQALRIRYDSLPADLRARADLAKGDEALPNLESARATAAHLEAATPIVAGLEDLHRERVKRVCTATSSVGLDDAGRHTLIAQVTGGAHTSSKTLEGVQAQAVIDSCTALQLGWLELELTADGVDQVKAVDWKAQARRLGTTQTDLLGRARALAEERDETFPKKLADVPVGYLPALLGGQEPTSDTSGPAPVVAPPPPAADLPASEVAEVVLGEPLTPAERVDVPVELEAGECVIVLHRPDGLTVRSVAADHPVVAALLELEAS
ncbi:hypothetical protein [Iamia sp.]|uniref:hypothetical protein n=1 Tax=Iamia sp. TaxID=2722710 RepID=UPI002BC3776C|nr:hypothetical protein [Iamia sp.]HXH58440.1 hypothetical protein [Iamia sp.]